MSPTPRLDTSGRVEAVLGAALLGWSTLAAVFVRIRPGENALDRLWFSLVPPSHRSSFLIHVTDLRTVPVLVVGSMVAALVAVGRDRWTAAACLAGPIMAVALVEWVVKPVVGRHYFNALSFPSGSVAVVAAVATAWVLAVPRRARWPVAVIGGVVVVLMIVAVVELGWHLASDALAGATFAAGTVLLVDGLLHLLIARPDRRRTVGTTAWGRST